MFTGHGQWVVSTVNVLRHLQVGSFQAAGKLSPWGRMPVTSQTTTELFPESNFKPSSQCQVLIMKAAGLSSKILHNIFVSFPPTIYSETQIGPCSAIYSLDQQQDGFRDTEIALLCSMICPQLQDQITNSRGLRAILNLFENSPKIVHNSRSQKLFSIKSVLYIFNCMLAGQLIPDPVEVCVCFKLCLKPGVPKLCTAAPCACLFFPHLYGPCTCLGGLLRFLHQNLERAGPLRILEGGRRWDGWRGVSGSCPWCQ